LLVSFSTHVNFHSHDNFSLLCLPAASPSLPKLTELLWPLLRPSRLTLFVQKMMPAYIPIPCHFDFLALQALSTDRASREDIIAVLPVQKPLLELYDSATSDNTWPSKAAVPAGTDSVVQHILSCGF
jgi:hypothetical protein